MLFFTKKKYLGNSGFSMAEIMVGVALMGVLAMAIMSQMKLVASSKKSSNENAIILRLSDKVGVELSRQETCSMAANFGGLTLTAAATNLPSGAIVDSNGSPILIVGSSYGAKVGGSSEAASNANVVKVTSITTMLNASNSDQLDLTITFQKKGGIASVFNSSSSITFPLSIVKDTTVTPNKVKYCYNDITNSIASAIRLSCTGNNSYYDPSANPPYGACKHYVDTTVCANNQYVKKVEVDGTGKLIFTCGTLPSCSGGKILTGFDTTGNAVCSYPFPSCGTGKIMIKSAAGPFICVNTDVGCTAPNALTKFRADGGVDCAYYYPPNSCAKRATSYDPATGTVACDNEVFKAVTCPPGYYISSFDATGTAQCTKYITTNYNCPAGYGATGVDGSGNLTCQQVMRSWCGGAASTHTYADCTAAGGSVMNGGTSNAVCKFGGASCPGGWTPCASWATTDTNQCTDTESHCPSQVRATQYATGGGFANPIAPYSVTCYNWADIPGDGVDYGACYQASSWTVSNSQTETGCY